MAQVLLFTGLPGHGKTLNAIKYVEEHYPDFNVFYAHIDDMSIERWKKLDDPKLWYECPSHSVVVIDEAHNYFPARGSSSRMPESVAKLSEHRHLGIDVVFITQNPKKLDHDVRNLVSHHFHFFRAFGMKSTKRFEWIKCQDSPDTNSAQSGAVSKSRVKIDKRYFGVYKSAEVHTVKRTIPKLFFLLPFLVCVAAGFIWFFISDMNSRARDAVISAPVAPAPVPAPAPAPAVYSAGVSSPSSLSESEFVPVVSGLVDMGNGRGILLVDYGGSRGYERYALYEVCSRSRRVRVRYHCTIDGRDFIF